MKHAHCLGGIGQTLKRIAEHLTRLGTGNRSAEKAAQWAKRQAAEYRRCCLDALTDGAKEAFWLRLCRRLCRRRIDLRRNIGTPRTGHACGKAPGGTLLRSLRSRRYLLRCRLRYLFRQCGWRCDMLPPPSQCLDGGLLPMLPEGLEGREAH